MVSFNNKTKQNKLSFVVVVVVLERNGNVSKSGANKQTRRIFLLLIFLTNIKQKYSPD